MLFRSHVTQELWVSLGNTTELYNEKWPEYDEKKSLPAKIVVAIQVNGKLRDTIEVFRDATEDAIKKTALERPLVVKWLDGKEPLKVIYVKGKILNIVIPA